MISSILSMRRRLQCALAKFSTGFIFGYGNAKITDVDKGLTELQSDIHRVPEKVS